MLFPLLLRLEEFTAEAYGSFHMETTEPVEILDVWLGIQKPHLCTLLCTYVKQYCEILTPRS